MTTSARDAWSKEELRASIEAYVEMQRNERARIPYTKKRYYEDLATKFGRTDKAFEYRMQNISYVLSLMGRDWLKGLKPAKNVGANVAAEIEALLAEVEGKKSLPVAAFEIAVKEKQVQKNLAQPPGNRTPKAAISSATTYQRDELVKAWVLQQANGTCECCRKPAPFNGTDGLPFLEVHHVRKLADGGTDTTGNALALCPNCHRELHYGENSKAMVQRLYQAIPRLIRE